MKISLYSPLSIHEIGQRQNQEDAINQWNNRLFVLCDGMGGHERGEVASQTVCQSLVKWFEENISDDTFTDDQLRAALEFAYSELDKQDEGGIKKMGTTLTLLYIHAQGVTAAHIGDSRIYHIRPDSSSPTGEFRRGLLYVSRDHSLVFDLYQSGEISFEEMRTSPQKNIITRAMQPGEENRVRPDIIHITDIQPGDWFYLCSDGMLENMSDSELADLFSAKTSDQDKRQKLIAATVSNQDNHTAWLIHVKEVVLESGDEALVNEEPTSRCNAMNLVPTFVENEIEKVDNEDDVVVVSVPHKSKKISKRTSYILALACCAIILIFALWALFTKGDGKKELQRSKPMAPIHHPIKSRDSMKKAEKHKTINLTDKKTDTIKLTPNESERHQ